MSQELTAIRRLFTKFADDGRNDDKTASLVPFILDEVGFAQGVSHSDEGIVRGNEALKLLKILPNNYPENPLLHVYSFPNTRYLLWEQIIRSILCSDGEDLRKFQFALINSGKISPEEKAKLKDAIKDELKKIAHDTKSRQKVCRILKDNSDTCDEVPLRALLHFVASNCTTDELKKLMT